MNGIRVALFAMLITMAVMAAPAMATTITEVPAKADRFESLVNKTRHSYNQSHLKHGAKADWAATKWNHSMIRNKYWGSTVNGDPFAAWTLKALDTAWVWGVRYYSCGYSSVSPRSVLRALKKKPLALAKLLVASEDRIGVDWTVFKGPFDKYKRRGKCVLVTSIMTSKTAT